RSWRRIVDVRRTPSGTPAAGGSGGTVEATQDAPEEAEDPSVVREGEPRLDEAVQGGEEGADDVHRAHPRPFPDSLDAVPHADAARLHSAEGRRDHRVV